MPLPYVWADIGKELQPTVTQGAAGVWSHHNRNGVVKATEISSFTVWGQQSSMRGLVWPSSRAPGVISDFLITCTPGVPAGVSSVSDKDCLKSRLDQSGEYYAHNVTQPISEEPSTYTWTGLWGANI